jgi:hypothetical protein
VALEFRRVLCAIHIHWSHADGLICGLREREDGLSIPIRAADLPHPEAYFGTFAP